MPCIYAHASFGKKVFHKLPEELKHIVKKYPREFQTGLQGPDFLFFYYPFLRLPTNQLGYGQHGRPLSEFLRSLLPSLRRRGTDNGAYAYLIGFICHFVLDSECHSYVIPQAEKPGYNHLVIENEFDRYLLQKDGCTALTYPVWKKFSCADEVVNAISQIYASLNVSKKKIRRALKGMRFYKRLLTCGCTLRRFLIRLLMKLTFHYRALEGHMMTIRPKRYAKRTNARLKKLYDDAIPLAVELLQDFHQTVTAGKPLHKRFDCTFRNNA